MALDVSGTTRSPGRAERLSFEDRLVAALGASRRARSRTPLVASQRKPEESHSYCSRPKASTKGQGSGKSLALRVNT
jgi:hypothetical protein